MKTLIEEYGIAIVSIIAILILFGFLGPGQEATKDTLSQVSEKTEQITSYSYEYTSTDQIKEYYSKMHESRNIGEGVTRDYSAVADQYSSEIRSLASSSNLIVPVESAEISASVWNYPESFGGGTHLGTDYAASSGTVIKAPANGVIVVSSDTCSTGFLGDKCSGDDEYAVSYGGNQIYLITSVNNHVYVITFSHMLAGSVHEKGIVYQGETIGKVGSSGNSTGSHCHIEVFYLGEGNFEDIESVYMRTPYTASFGCGWGDTALYKTCTTDSMYSACRLNPETVFQDASSVSVGDAITMNVDGTNRNYRILKVNGSVVEVVSMWGFQTSYDYLNSSNYPQTEYSNGETYWTYAGSSLDVLLNSTWYNSLTDTAKSAIVQRVITENLWGDVEESEVKDGSEYFTSYYGDEGKYKRRFVKENVSSQIGSRYAYLLSLSDLESYLGNSFTNAELREMFTGTSSSSENIALRSLGFIADEKNVSSIPEYNTSDNAVGNSWGVCFISDASGAIKYSWNYEVSIHPAFTIDLAKISYTKN